MRDSNKIILLFLILSVVVVVTLIGQLNLVNIVIVIFYFGLLAFFSRYVSSKKSKKLIIGLNCVTIAILLLKHILFP